MGVGVGSVHMVTAARDARPVVLVADPDGAGGAEIYLAHIVGALAGRHDFIALIGERTGEMARRQLESAGARVRRIPGLGRIPRLEGLVRLARALRALDPLVVHVNATDQGDGLSAILAARALRLPFVVTVHVPLTGRAARHEALSGRTLRAADAVIAVSGGVAAHLAGLGVEATVVQNGVPVPTPAPEGRRALDLDPGAFVVGGIGRLSEQKGWDVLCRAAPVLRARRPDAVVAIIGEGTERPRLEGLARTHGVRLLGLRENASALLSAFDVLAAPSRYEGSSLVAMEAMHAGVPVVAADIGVLREVVGDGGMLVAPGDANALGTALGTLATDRAAHADLVARGHARAATHFTVQRMADETAAVYALVAGRRAGGSVTMPA